MGTKGCNVLLRIDILPSNTSKDERQTLTGIGSFRIFWVMLTNPRWGRPTLPLCSWSSRYISSKYWSICCSWIRKKSFVESTNWSSNSSRANWGWYSPLNSTVRDRSALPTDSSISLKHSWDAGTTSGQGISTGISGSRAEDCSWVSGTICWTN